MEQLTDDERAEWIADSIDALRGRMMLRSCDVEQAYAELAAERVWRWDAVASEVLHQAYQRMHLADRP
ncbi:MAG: hypothetical protein L0K27_00455 [Corynebacterium nuruki]|nr:hypothetical protein [Corynebacterium nuruki]